MSGRLQGATERARRHAQRGFTILELMVALTVGGIAISSIYAIGAAATRQFYTQQQVAGAQTSLRMALNQVKRDVARAGFLSTPSVGAPGQACALPTTLFHDPPNMSIAAIARFTDNIAINTATNGNGNVDPTGTNVAVGASVDEIVLLGNYETGNEYSGVRRINDNEIAISSNWYAFQHDFGGWYDPANLPFVDEAFGRAFRGGRYIRIRTTTGLSHFATVVLNDPYDPPEPGPPAIDTRLRFMEPVPANCQAGVTGGWVAPVSAIRYVVQNAPENTVERQRNLANPGTAVPAGLANPMAQLLRVEVQPDDKVTPLDAAGLPPRVIADYVVGFNLTFTMSTQGTPDLPDIYTIGDTTNDETTVNSNPQRVRGVTIDLAVRTPEQDRTLFWSTDATTGCGNLRCFKVTAQPGAARVRRMSVEVFLPNVATEGY